MAEKKRIALVGGAGFIGHHLALKLKAQGHEVHIVDSLYVNNLLTFSSTSSKDNEFQSNDLYLDIINERLRLLREARIPLHVQDARDYNLLAKVLGTIKPQVVILLAAVAHAGTSNKDPYSTFDHSLRTLENALDCSRGRIEHFIYFSSSMVYGNFVEESVTESSPCEPVGIYGSLKYAGEKIVIAYNQVFDLPYTIIRPSALYGERCVSRRVGQIFIESALNGKELLVEGDGGERLDFTYIGDLVDGVSQVIDHPGARNQIFNLTYGESRSVKDMLNIMQKFFPGVNVRYTPRDKLMPKRGTLCVDKARELIGYVPKYPLEKAFPQYIEWYKSFLSRR